MKIEGRIFELPRITATVSTVDQLNGNIGAKTINVGGRPYEGEYDVNPTFNKQELNTRGAILQENIVVNSISVNKSANSSGGNTVVIGD